MPVRPTTQEKVRWSYHSLADTIDFVFFGNSKSSDFRLLSVIFYVFCFVVFGPVALVLALSAKVLGVNTSRLNKLAGFGFLYLVGAIVTLIAFTGGLVSFTKLSTPENLFADGVLLGIIGLWYFMILFFPLVYFGGTILTFLSKYFPVAINAKDELERAELEKRQREEQAREAAQKNMGRTIEPANQMINIGTVISGEQFPRDVKIEQYRGWLRLHESVLDRHMFILGTTGAGKTELILRLCYEVLQNTNRNLYIVDGKGEMAFAETVASMCYQIRGHEVPVFKLGHLHSGAVYNGFSGSADSIFNRLAYMVGVMNATTGEGSHYTEINKRLLQMVCLSGMDGKQIIRTGKYDAPRSFQEAISRLDYTWLKEAYAGIPMAQPGIEMAKAEKAIFDLYNRLYNLTNSFGDIVNPNGFTLEDTRCAVFSLKTNAAGVEAKSLLDFLNSDIQDFIANRITKPSLMIIDEFGSFANENIVNILSQSRSSQLGVCLATQTISSLGDPTVQSKVLENCNTHVMMKTMKGEALAEFAGTRMGAEMSIQLKEGMETGTQSARHQHQMRAHPQEAKELKPGEAFVINSGKAVKIKVARVENIQKNPRAIARNVYDKDTKQFRAVEINQAPKATTPPPPQKRDLPE